MKASTAVLLLLLTVSNNASAQHKNWCECRHGEYPTSLVKHRYGLWPNMVCPSTVVDGMAIGFIAMPQFKDYTLDIHGVNIEANPLPVLATFYMPFLCLVRGPAIIAARKKASVGDTSPVKTKNDPFSFEDSVIRTTVKGLDISTGIVLTQTNVKGAAINMSWAIHQEMHGAEVSSLFNFHQFFSGVIAAPFNFCRKGKGVQIGLYNYCRDGKVVQIGLINKCGKRILPIFNGTFMKPKK